MIRKLALCFALAVAFVQASAQPQPVQPCPPFAPHLMQDYDAMTPGLYTPQVNVFAIQAPPFINIVVGTANIINPSGIFAILGQPPAPFTPPNYMYSRQTDVEWRFLIPIRRFGGAFTAILPNTVARFDFYNVSNTLIASHVVNFGAPMTWQWVGFCHVNGPQIRRIVVTTLSGFQGLVAYDNTMIRYN
jgi:hypothetical protein